MNIPHDADLPIRPSVWCSEISVDVLTGERVPLWAPGDSTWRHKICDQGRGVYFRGFVGEGTARHKTYARCSCPCHAAPREPRAEC